MPGVLGAGIRRGVHVRLVERQEIGFVAIASRRGRPIVSGSLDARPWVAVDRVAVPIAIRLKEDATGSGKGDNTRICNSGGILIVRLVNGRDIGRITRRGGPAEFIREEKQAVALIIFTLQEAGVLDTVYRRCLSFVQQVFPFFPGRNPAGAGIHRDAPVLFRRQGLSLLQAGQVICSVRDDGPGAVAPGEKGNQVRIVIGAVPAGLIPEGPSARGWLVGDVELGGVHSFSFADGIRNIGFFRIVIGGNAAFQRPVVVDLVIYGNGRIDLDDALVSAEGTLGITGIRI